jgi:Sulfotransferase family
MPARWPTASTTARGPRPRVSPAGDVSVRFPDFFLIGAPRSGTTSLSRYLAANPQVCFSRPKEPHYFALLAPHSSLEDLETAYLSRYFAHYHDGHRVVGEGSVSYLYSPQAIERILEVNPDARFIAILRNPLEMLPSYHLRMLFILCEDVENFAAAWRLQDARARGQRVPRHCIDARMLLYREVARYGVQIARLYRVAGRDRCHVVVFDDLARDAGAVYRDVLKFIGVDDDCRTMFERRQRSRIYRFRWLQELLYSIRSRHAHAIDTRQRTARAREGAGRRKSLVKRLARWNRIERRPAPLDAEMRATLRAAFADDVTMLSDLLGRDLRHWSR